MHLQIDVFHPVIGGLNKVVEKAVPSFLNKTLEEGISLIIDHWHEKTSLTAPEEKLEDYYSGIS